MSAGLEKVAELAGSTTWARLAPELVEAGDLEVVVGRVGASGGVAAASAASAGEAPPRKDPPSSYDILVKSGGENTGTERGRDEILGGALK